MASNIVDELWNRAHGRTIRTIWGDQYTAEEWRTECERVLTLRKTLKEQTPFLPERSRRQS